MEIFKQYKGIQKYIYYLIIAELLIQIVNATFLILVNYYLLEQGYKDYEIASFTSYRYITVLFLGIPAGLLYKKINFLPMIKLGTILFIANAMAIILLAPTHREYMPVLMSLFGIFILMSHVVALPFLMRIVDKDKISVALSMFFQTWAVSIVFIGFINYTIHFVFPNMVSLKYIIMTLFGISSLAIVFLAMIPNKIQFQSQSAIDKPKLSLSKKEIKNIFIILIPTIIIAVGAGFCIPFFNLFFHFTYDINANGYASIVSVSHILVFGFMLFTPYIKEKFGYRFGMLGIQSAGVFTLMMLTWSHLIFPIPWAMIISVGFFIIRQPLMNSAQPLIAEFTLEKVGKENQPLVGSIEATIWSGSFWISSLLFSTLREMNIDYATIFNITIGLYIVGVASWYFVIGYFEKRVSE